MAAVEHKTRPTRPNEDAFKADLAQAEKEHAAAQEKLVCLAIGWSPPLYGH
jgi:hypothetical protein